MTKPILEQVSDYTYHDIGNRDEMLALLEQYNIVLQKRLNEYTYDKFVGKLYTNAT